MEHTLHIEALAPGGAGVAHRADGKTVFVDGAAPGDTVRVHIDSEKPSFARGKLAEVLEASPQRVGPTCPLAGTCGGCTWQHVSYEAQLKAKRQNVVEALKRIGHMEASEAERLVGACVPSKRTMGYRNKVELSCTTDAKHRLVLGMHEPARENVVPVTHCPLAVRPIAKAAGSLQGALRYLEGANPGSLGLFRVGMRCSLRTHSLQVALWATPGPFPRAAVAKTLLQSVRATSIVRVLANPGNERKVKKVEVLSGGAIWEEELDGMGYAASAPSFFQVNTAQAETLVALVMEGLQPGGGQTVADLYCGVGTFTLPLADAGAWVLAVESSGPAVRDLRRNLDDAGLDAEVVGGDAARELPQLGTLDALVVDPPRAGLAKDMPQAIAQAGPSRIAYVSCDAATWARDAQRLANCGYSLERAVPVDLFPQTHHCELVSFFAKA